MQKSHNYYLYVSSVTQHKIVWNNLQNILWLQTEMLRFFGSLRIIL